MANDDTATLDADELLHLALHATQNNQTDKAIELLKKALSTSPDNGKAHYLLGALYAEIGLYDRAVEQMGTAVELEPGLSTAHFQLGLLHLTSGRIKEAEQAWKPLDKLDQQEPLFLFKRGMLHLVEDKFEACIADLQKGIAGNTFNEDLNNDMRKIIAAAEKAMEANRGSKTDEQDSGEDGKHILLSAYQRDEDD